MSNETDIELVQADIDGEISETQREGLRARLAASPELRAYQASVRELVDILDSVPALEPPVDLRQDLLQRLSGHPGRKEPRVSAGWRWAPPALRYAAACAAGIGIAAILHETMSLGDQSPEQLARLAGTMLYQEAPPEAALQDRLVLEEDELRGEVALQRNSDAWVVTFHLDSGAPVAVAMEFGDLPFRGFAQLRNALEDMSVTDGAMRVLSTGQQEFAVFLGQNANDEVRLDLRFYSGNQQITGGSLSVPH